MTNGCHAIGDYYACQTCAATESKITDRCHVARNPNACQAIAVRKHLIADGCHAVRNHKACQTIAAIEGTRTNRCHAAWNLNVCQARASIKSTTTDGCHGIVLTIMINGSRNDDVTLIRFRSFCHRCRMRLFIKTIIESGFVISRLQVAHELDVNIGGFVARGPFGIESGLVKDVALGLLLNRLPTPLENEVVAVFICPFQNRRVGKAIHVGEGNAIIERVSTDGCHAGRDVDRCQRDAEGKGCVADEGQAFGKGDGGQVVGSAEGETVDGRHAIGDDVLRPVIAYRIVHQFLAVLGEERAIHALVVGIVISHRKLLHGFAFRESTAADAGQAGWNGDRFQFVAEANGIIANARHAFWDDDGSEITVVSESIFANVCHSLGNGIKGVRFSGREFNQRFAILGEENAVNAFVDGIVGSHIEGLPCPAQKRVITHIRQAGRDGNSGHAEWKHHFAELRHTLRNLIGSVGLSIGIEQNFCPVLGEDHSIHALVGGIILCHHDGLQVRALQEERPIHL